MLVIADDHGQFSLVDVVDHAIERVQRHTVVESFSYQLESGRTTAATGLIKAILDVVAQQRQRQIGVERVLGILGQRVVGGHQVGIDAPVGDYDQAVDPVRQRQDFHYVS